MASTLHRTRDGFFSAESSYGGNWKLGELKGRRGSSSTWRDDAFAPSITSFNASPSSSSSSSSSPSSSSRPNPKLVSNGGSDGAVDKVLYQNLVEMIPLVETFMDRRNTKAFTRQRASLIYTPTPARDPALPHKKAVEHRSKGARRSCDRQLPRCRRVELKDGRLWDNTGNMPLFSMNTELDMKGVNKATIARLQSQIEHLEVMLQEKESQFLSIPEDNSRQLSILCLETQVEELQNEVVLKNRELQKGMELLKDKQHMIASLCSRLDEAELEVQASNLNVEKVHEELHNLQCQVATFLIHIQSLSSSLEDELIFDQVEDMSSSTEANDEKQPQRDETERDRLQTELMRRKYLASLIVARHNPSDESMLLVAELRGQLQSYLREQGMISFP